MLPHIPYKVFRIQCLYEIYNLVFCSQVTVYNPLGQAIDHYVRVPVAGSDYIVRDSVGEQL